MKSLAKKLLVLGLGGAALSKDKAKKLKDEMKKKLGLKATDTKEVFDAYLKEARKQGNVAEKKIKARITKEVKNAKVSAKKELLALEKKLAVKGKVTFKNGAKKVQQKVFHVKAKAKQTAKKVTKKPTKKSVRKK